MIAPLLANLEQRDRLSDAEKASLRAILTRERRVAAQEDIVMEGDRPTTSSLLLEGFAARYNMTGEGQRQLTSLHVPGEFIDLHAFLAKTMDHGIVALSPCRIAMAEHSAMRDITERTPHVARLLWLDTLIQGAISRQWIVAMGRRSRAAHLSQIICELYMRLQIVDQIEDDSFHFPLSQLQMADIMGLSLVHMNRVIQELRAAGFISWTRERIAIHDWERLKAFAGFDPTYLHLRSEPR
ncbi:Crp/Fnr family transcriptional regulator [Rhizobium sp. CSW-27]|uniref:Crp/Fnr family transcriptional regulator n=1 Tax=Rhizobium sp. CSW-27 TaxID=2839985 RepID=UPI001C01212C|nr:Crp/Fnr family transcriptional regulator [Rhizobium sp. CSW-27]MBT9370941.1 Crp/Fnr family transcriptional regulator [Rhizobium sp. CSW-27]